MTRTKKAAAQAKPGNDYRNWWVMLLLALAVFLFDRGARDPFLAVRMIALAGGGIATLAWLLAQRKPLLFNGWPTRPFLLLGLGFLLYNLLSASQAYDIQESSFFLARYSLHFALLLLLLALLPKPEVQALALARFMVAVLAIYALSGIAQYYGVMPFDIPGTLRPTGFSGNRNLFGAFLVLLMPWGVYYFFQSKGAWRAATIATLTLSVYALVLSQTRSAWLSFALMAVCFQILLLVFRHKLSGQTRRQWKKALLAGSMGLVAAVGLAFISGKNSQLANSLKWRVQTFISLPAADAEPANEAERNALERLYVWRHTLEMSQAHPWLGVGPGNWRVRFPEYGGSSAPSFEGIDQMRIRPHNVYLGLASETGLPGLLLFLAMGGLALAAAAMAARQAQSEGEALLAISLFSGLIAATVDMGFSFPIERAEHNLLLLLYAAMALSLAARRLPSSSAPRLPSAFFALAILALLSFALWMGWQKQRLDRQLQAILKLEQAGNFELAALKSEQAEALFFKLDPIGDPIQWHSANAYKQLQQLDKALAKAEAAEAAQPNSHRVLNTKASILMGMERFSDAIPPLEKAVALAPSYEPALTNLAYSLYRTDQYEACLEVLGKFDIENNPNLKLVRADAGERVEMAILEGMPMYQLGRELAAQLQTRGYLAEPSPALAFYRQQPSDEQVVQDFFKTINHYCRAKNWASGATAEQVEALSLYLEKARESLLQEAGPAKAIPMILNNNHVQTVGYLLSQAPDSLGHYQKMFFPMNQ